MVNLQKLLVPENRGNLLDIIVFLVNLVLMFVLARLFADLARASNANDKLATFGVVVFCLGVVFLQPIASVLKRRRAHQRNPTLDRPRPRFLFHPVFYFLSKLIFLIASAGLIIELVFGDQIDGGPGANYFGLPPWLFILLFPGIPALAIANTALVYFYFRKPKRVALLSFLDSPQSEAVGDICFSST